MYKDKRGLWREYIIFRGKRKYFSAKTKKDLLLKLAAFNINSPEVLTFSEVADAWREEHWEQLQFGSYRTYAPAFRRAVEQFGSRNIEDIKPKDVQLWLKKLGETYAYKTVSNHKTIVSQIYDYAILNFKAKPYNPCDRIKVPSGLKKGTREPLSYEELLAVLSTTKDEFQLGFLILFTGCRLGEANALQMSDVDFKKNEIYIYKSTFWKSNRPFIKVPKTEAGTRIVPLLPRLKERLLELNLPPSAYIVSQTSEPLTLSAISRRWESWCRSRGLAVEEHRTPTPTNKHTSVWKPTIERHQIRHSYASILYEAGIDPKAAQSLLGHAQLSTTMDIYTHISERKRQEDFLKLANYKIG